jgi:hypothetical protein
VLGEWGIPRDSPAGRRTFERLLEVRRRQAEDEAFKPIRRGWCFGDEAFRQELLEKVATHAGPQHYGEELREAAAATGERIVREELRRRGWPEHELTVRRKGDPGKVAIADRLRRETTMTLEWIAHRLQMGTKTHLAHLLYWRRRKG